MKLVAGDTVARRYTATLLGDGGVGKSSLIISVSASPTLLYFAADYTLNRWNQTIVVREIVLWYATTHAVTNGLLT
jgi:predicted ATP-dependent serine protease